MRKCSICGASLEGKPGSRKACEGECAREAERIRKRSLAYKVKQRAKQNRLYATSARYRSRHNEYTRDYRRERYRSDPAFRQHILDYQRERNRKRESVSADHGE